MASAGENESDLLTRLEELEEFVRGVVEQTADIIVIHQQGRIVYANQRAADTLGIPLDQLIDQPADAFVHPEDREMVTARMRRSPSSPDDMPVLVERYVRSDGATLYGEVTGRGVRYKGQPAGLVIVRDITARLQAEERDRRAKRLESLAQLAGSVAHDFNNLLLGVLGNVGLALDEVEHDSPVRARLENIEKAALSASELTRQLIAYSGGGELDRQRFDLAGLVRETVELVKISTPDALRVDLALEEGIEVIADRTQILQVLMNLLLNAAEALRDTTGRVEIRTRRILADRKMLGSNYLEDELPEGPYVLLEVIDDGEGMDGRTQAMIFEPFFSTKPEGRGLGLSAVLGIIRSHGGGIQLDSQPGRGTAFRLLLPEGAAEEEEEEEEERRPAPAKHRELILVADDEPEALAFVADALEHAGFETLRARDGREALDLFHQRPADFSAVVLDLLMPAMDGWQVCEAIRKVRPGMPVLLTSGSSTAAPLGGGGFLRKPFQPEDLIRSLRALLPRKSKTG
ncbi:MAG: PAS domain S-box protein [Deltaproteobacteria bacterium]|nr:PAS domain S-box protein [Deltaproteobacteria bacterium]